MSFPAYPEYKHSGVSWLGEVPRPWERKPLFALVRELDDKNDGMQESNLLSLSYGRIKRKSIEGADGLLPASFETYQIVERDDIIWRLTDLQNDQRSLRTGIARERGIITSAYLATRPTGISPEFLAYLLRAYDLTKVFYSMGGGLRQSMKFGDVKWLPVMLPSPDEQRAIAAFLDRETAKIDALVAEQERLIALLKEKRQAVISHTVTKGLDPDAPMKDSGIEWLGEIPAHWEIIKVVRLFRASKGKEGQILTKEYCAEHEGEYPVYSGQTENNGVMGLLDRYEFDAGDAGFLFSTTVGAKAMSVSHIFGKFSLSQNCMIIRPTSANTHPRFYYYHFQQAFAHHRAMIPDHMQPSFRMDDLYGFQVAMPPVSEQIEIAQYLDNEYDALQGLNSEAQQAINLLKERRAALISAAVTGKIDVRELVDQHEMEAA